jgi:DNA repair protein RecO (recombination protein O)
MALTRDRCICVRKTEYSETSQILTLFGREHGMLRVIAKGAHRSTKAGYSKFDGGVDLLDVGYAVFTFDQAKDLNTLTEWNLREGNLHLRKNLRGMYLGLYAAEMVSLLIEEHDAHPELYVRLEKSLRQLASAAAEETFMAFQLDLLHTTGTLADPGACVECGRGLFEDRTPTYFSPRQGGAICSTCQSSVSDRVRFDSQLLMLAQQVLCAPRIHGVATRLPRLTRLQADPLNRLFAGQVEQILGKRMRMPEYVLETRNPKPEIRINA